ncbi:hypothetical protein C8F04DRAFT_1268257 [Mycena alexandri]|uniref:Uncharacterized protein n=1 Tax=Mycena alexandri TaxID=1745969 RepID=A0AAD6SFZ9_9AGAR|nr:hypothetical protein C8F04DRAFT_1268257 [Mycena alexandri]
MGEILSAWSRMFLLRMCRMRPAPYTSSSGHSPVRYVNPSLYTVDSFLTRNLDLDVVACPQCKEKGDFRDGRREFFHDYAWLIPNDTPDRRTACDRPRHPLLFDFESARLHVLLLILRRKQYFDIAWLLNDLLRIRFIDNYAIGHLLTAGFLDNPAAGFTENSYYTYSDPESSSSGLEPSVPGGNASDPAGATSTSSAPAVDREFVGNSCDSSHSSSSTGCDDGDACKGFRSPECDSSYSALFSGSSGDRRVEPFCAQPTFDFQYSRSAAMAMAN